uniref:Prospero homeobox protein 1-like n=1 Tax=Cyprinodon variegatus TaxID=28743 RepID=A0A3Q2G7A7_CYPVA
MSLWSKGMYSSRDICLDDCAVEHLHLNYPEPPSTNLGLFYKDSKSIKGPIHRTENAPGLPCSSPLEFDLSGGRTRSPSSYGHQVKRARVENIIKGITCVDMTQNLNEETDCTQEEEGVDVLAFHQKRMETRGGESLRESHQPLRDESKSSQDIRDEEWKKGKSDVNSKPGRVKLMADVLKYELTRAVSNSVDSIFKSMALIQSPTEMESLGSASQTAVCMESKLRCGTEEVKLHDMQTEALSLVVQKPEPEQPKNFTLQSTSAAPLIPKPPFCVSRQPEPSVRHNSTDHQRHAFRCLQEGCAEGEPRLETYWNSVKVKSKVNSRSVRSPLAMPVDQVVLETLHLPNVKLEPDSLEKNNLYMSNECLTTNHLKKAKLMFFYTRYPSSVVLRMCFHDVQFTRCITSQLIKWFSNFREYYYIQMEKFARSALLQGATDVRDLTVGRESELFRALNMHYNKANDFQVPDRFLEVAEITLREFYIAISMGRDRDPSWKKTIYKVICKLDSDVPPEFKSQNFA